MSVSQVVPIDPIVRSADFALSGMVKAIKALYVVAGDISVFIDEHIKKLQTSENPLIASTGRVLEAAKYGFGIGYMSSVAIIAVGQLLLGNPLTAAAAVLTGVTLTNPIAMTCAAIGAIYYGWHALTDSERAQILERLGNGLDMGIELIRSMVEFAIRKSKDLMTPSQLGEAKDYVKAQAARFGNSLYDVTRKVSDAVRDGAERTGKLLGRAGEAVGDAASDTFDSVAEAGGKLKKAIGRTAQRGSRDKLHVAGSIAPFALPDPQKTTAETPIRMTLAEPKSKTPIRKMLAKPKSKP